jgi:hypothetical protein
MRTAPSKYKGEKPETLHVVARCVRGVFIKATVKNWIMRDTTVQVRYETYQLAWYLGMQIASANPHIGEVIKHVLK